MAWNQGILSVEGFTGATGEPLFLWGFDTADNVAIDTIWQKYTIWQKSGVSAIVYSGKVKKDRILRILVEKCISLAKNDVEIWEIWHIITETCWSFRDNTGSFRDGLEFRLEVCEIC